MHLLLVCKSTFNPLYARAIDDVVLFLQYIASPHPYQYYTGHAPSIIHAMPMGESEQTSNAASPDESYQAYQPQPPK